MKKSITKTWEFNQSPEIVWEYLTNPDLLELWFAKTDFKPVPGHQFTIGGKDGCFNYCEVLSVEPPLRLSYSWRFASAKDKQYYDSTVVWTLRKNGDQTLLELHHDGFLEAVDFDRHNSGWTFLVNQMVEQLKPVTQ